MSLSTEIRSVLPGNWRPLRLATLVGLRWLAVIGQTIGVLFVAWGLGYPLPLVECLSLIALSVVVNLALPRFLAPQDSVHLTLNLDNVDGGAGTAQLKMTVTGGLKLGDYATQVILAPKEKKQVALTLTAEKIGDASAQIVGIRMRLRGMQSRHLVETRQRDIDSDGAGAGNESQEKRGVVRHEDYFAEASCKLSSLSSLASMGADCCLKRASSVAGSGSGLGRVTVSGLRCVPSTRNS